MSPLSVSGATFTLVLVVLDRTGLGPRVGEGCGSGSGRALNSI